jgi:MFS family permease
MVWLLAIAQIVSWGSLYYSFSFFVLPMQTSLGYGLPLLNGALTVGLLVTGALAPAVGAHVDRHGARTVMTAGSIAAALLLLAWSTLETAPAFYLVWLGLGATLAAVLYEPAMATVTQHFGTEARRGITALTLVAGFASTVFMPLTQTLLAHFDWRTTLRLLALCHVAIALPIHATCIPRRPPQPPRETTSGTETFRPHRHPAFAGLALWLTANSVVFATVTFEFVPLMKSRGVAPGLVMLAVALFGPSQVLGRIVMLAGGARITTRSAGTLTTLLMPAAMLILILGPTQTVGLCLFAFCYGLANGITTILRGVAPAELVGTAGYARTMGALAVPAMVAIALSPLAMASIWRLGGDSAPMLWTAFAWSVAGALGFQHALRHDKARGVD